jgi:hypothetical protein
MKTTLACHSQGDRRFSPFYALITFLGKRETIETIYQLAKRIGDYVPTSMMDGKGRKATHYCIGGVIFDTSYLEVFYQSLWVIYFKQNPDLYDYACTFDNFHDMFKGKSKVNQEKTIRRIVRIGLDNAAKECYPFLLELSNRRKLNHGS